MGTQAVKRVDKYSEAQGSASRVMQFLARESGDKLWCHPTVGSIASAVDLSTRQVQRILKRLEAEHEIERTRRGFTLLCRHQIEIEGDGTHNIVGLDVRINGTGVIGHYYWGDIPGIRVTSRGDIINVGVTSGATWGVT